MNVSICRKKRRMFAMFQVNSNRQTDLITDRRTWLYWLMRWSSYIINIYYILYCVSFRDHIGNTTFGHNIVMEVFVLFDFFNDVLRMLDSELHMVWKPKCLDKMRQIDVLEMFHFKFINFNDRSTNFLWINGKFRWNFQWSRSLISPMLIVIYVLTTTLKTLNPSPPLWP